MKKILFVFAHPDDETYGTGGTIAKLSREGFFISLITATNGQAGQTGEYGAISPGELGEIRKKEQKKAAEILGISKIHYLDLMDGELYKHRITKLSLLILKIIKNENPDVVITFEKHGGSNHPDHKKISYATTHAFYEYIKTAKKNIKLYHTAVPRSYLKVYQEKGMANTGFGRPKGTADYEITTRVDISQTFDLKHKAALCHKSQIKDWDRILKRVEHVDLKKEFFKLIWESEII